MMQQLSESTSIVRKLTDRAVPRPRRGLRVLPTLSSPTPEPLAPALPNPSRALDRLYSAAFGFVLHPLVNQRSRCVPLVFDHPADLAAVRRALELVSTEGGFDARVRRVWQIEARVCLRGARAAADVAARLREQKDDLFQIATQAIASRARGELPLALEILPSSGSEVQLHLKIEASEHDGLEAALHDAARAIAPILIRVAGVRPSVRVSREASDRVRVRCRIRDERVLTSALGSPGPDGQARDETAVARATAALAAGASNPTIAAAHNAMIEHGIAAVALALGNAPGRITRGLEQHAARRGGCVPLCNWRTRDDGIEGELELPVDLDTHGRWQAELATDAGAALDGARDIALLAACVGMAGSVIALEDAVRARALERLPSHHKFVQSVSKDSS